MSSSVLQRRFRYNTTTGKIYFTYEDLQSIPQWPDGPLIELFNGELFMAPSPTIYHQEISANLMQILRTHVKLHNLGFMWAAPVDVILSATDVIIPDILFVSNKHASIIQNNNIRGTPDFVIEILSTNRVTDLTTKKQLYEKYGVNEYWIVDPVTKSLEVFLLQKNNYISQGQYSTEVYCVTLDLHVNLTEVF